MFKANPATPTTSECCVADLLPNLRRLEEIHDMLQSMETVITSKTQESPVELLNSTVSREEIGALCTLLSEGLRTPHGVDILLVTLPALIQAKQKTETSVRRTPVATDRGVKY